MDLLRHRLREFNSHSQNTENHFKLCDDNTLKLCSTHPRLITCTASSTHIHVQHNGPAAFSLSLPHTDPASLQTLLELLHQHGDDGDSLLDWELDDWVSAGYPGRMFTIQQDTRPEMAFTPEDLWCIDLFPSRKVLDFSGGSSTNTL